MQRELQIENAEWDSIIEELQTVADVTIGNDLVTVSSRRIVREEMARENVRNRVARHRSNAEVTPEKRVSNEQKLEVRSQKSYKDPLTPASGEACFYCQTAAEKAGGLRLDEHPPEQVTAPVWTCVICATIKRDRYFVLVSDCRTYIHKMLWATNRARWIQHRKYAFGGKSPNERAKPPKEPDPNPEDLPTPEEVRAIIEASEIGKKGLIRAHAVAEDRNEKEIREAS